MTSEKPVRVPATDPGINIHGIVRTETNENESPLIVFAPGLGGKINDLLPYSTARYLSRIGMDSVRIEFYGNQPDQRDIVGCSIHNMARDIDTVVQYFSKSGYEKIAVIGHSYGAMAVVYSDDQKFDAAVLWDPSHTDAYDNHSRKKEILSDYVYVEAIDAYVSGRGSGHVLPRSIFIDYQPGSVKKARAFNVASLIINAEQSERMVGYGLSYSQNIEGGTTHAIIPGSSHKFTEETVLDSLLDTTGWWLRNIFKQTTQ